MLRVGMEVEIRGKYARRFWYKEVVGKKGIIKRLAKGHVEVKVEGSYGFWHIQYDDCFPTRPASNKVASMLLDKEW